MLIKLMLGVRQFQNEFNDMKEIFQHLRRGQSPEILFITCADSRIIPSLLTQSGPGDLFVIRNVGNIIPPHPISSSEAAGITYALKVLDSIKDIIICGHSHCGAMKGLLTHDLKESLPEVASWLVHSHTVLEQMPANFANLSLKIEFASKKNILLQLEHLRSYPIVAEKLANKEITLHGWFYEFESGQILVYEEKYKDFIPFDQALALAVRARRDKIIRQEAMQYLQAFANPQSSEQYQKLMQLFALLKKDLFLIYPAIKEDVTKKLWAELGGLYTSDQDPQFITLLKEGSQLQLGQLDEFKKNIMESRGYRKYMGAMLRHSMFAPSQFSETSETPGAADFIRYL